MEKLVFIKGSLVLTDKLKDVGIVMESFDSFNNLGAVLVWWLRPNRYEVNPFFEKISHFRSGDYKIVWQPK